jgi:transposase
VQSGRAIGTPKAGSGRVEAHPRPAHRARQRPGRPLAGGNQLHGMRVTASDELREEPRGLSLARLSLRASRFRVPTVVDTPLAATRLALRSLAQRFMQLSAEIARFDVQLARLVAAAAPQLVARPGIGNQIAGQLLVTAGANPTRLRSEGAFAMLVGTAPIPASSGKTERQRLNRAGDRQANSALYMLALSRMSRDPRTQAMSGDAPPRARPSRRSSAA